MIKRYLIIFILGVSIILAGELEFVRNFGENPGHLRMFTYIPQEIDSSKTYL